VEITVSLLYCIIIGECVLYRRRFAERARASMLPRLAIGRSWGSGKQCLNQGWKDLVGCRGGLRKTDDAWTPDFWEREPRTAWTAT
jgi:hypothetical protein